MMQVRKAQDRGVNKISWLESYHTFSFGQYYDENHMGYSHLRVINDDIVQPSGGFAEHGHRDMEIITYVLDGALEHKDSLGTGSVIKPGEVQIMSAGSGIRHSEYNHSDRDMVHFLQIWVEPNKTGIEPRYQQKDFGTPNSDLQLVASGDGRDGSLYIHQDADMYRCQLDYGQGITHQIAEARKLWLHVAKGSVIANGEALEAGDGLAVWNEENLSVTTAKQGEFLLFDLAE